MKEIMMGVPAENDDILLTEHRAIVCFPENSVEVTIEAKVFQDGKLVDVKKKLAMEDIREAFHKADDGYIDDSDRFVITEAGKKWLEENEAK